MSDKFSAQDDSDTLPPGEDSYTAAPVATAKGGNALAGLALLLALAGLGLAGWTAWQWQQNRRPDTAWQDDLGKTQAVLQRGLERQGSQIGSLESRLADLPDAKALAEQRRLLLALQGDQQNLAQGLAQINARSRQSWRLNEARHLVRLAQLRLSALHDLASAESLLQAADDILQAQDDPLAFAARGALTKALETLHSLPHPDSSGLYQQLAALREQAAGLQATAPEFVVDDAARRRQQQAEQSPWWDWRRWRDRVSGYVRLEVKANSDIRRQLSAQSLAQARLALSLALEQAQWGALNARQAVYEKSLEQARQLLKEYFDPRQGQALQQRLEALAGQPVEVQPPDLQPALLSLENYLQERQGKDAEVNKSAAPTKPPVDRPDQPKDQPGGDGSTPKQEWPEKDHQQQKKGKSGDGGQAA